MKKKLFRDEYLVNPNCTHYELDPDDTPVPGRYDNYGCDCDCDCPPPPPPHIEPNDANRAYFVHPHPPRGPMPPHIPNVPPQPRFPNARHPIVLPRKAINPPPHDPVLGHYLMPERHYAQWLIKQLSLYPRLNDSCVVQGLWTFCKDLLIRNPHACIDAPAKWNEDRLESSVVFTDHCSKELGRITLYKLKSGEIGLELSIGDGKSLGLRDIEDGVISHAPTPKDIDDNEIATVGWVRDALLDLLTEITDSEPTEGSDKFVNSGDIYTWVTNLFQRKLTFDTTPTAGSDNPVTSSGIHDAIEAIKVILDPTVTANSQKGVTSAGIYDFVTDAISNINSFTLPIATNARLGGIKVGDYLKITNAGILSVDFEAIASALSNNSTSAGGNSWKVFYYDSWAGANKRNLAIAAINAALAEGYWVCAYNAIGWSGWSGCSGGGSGGTRIYVWLYAPGAAISTMDAAAIEQDRHYPTAPTGVTTSNNSGNAQQYSSGPVYEGMTASNAVHPQYGPSEINW